MNNRYTRNIGTITEREQEMLARKSACVVGCGGLGGGVIEGLVRMGVGKLTVIDCDSFDETNLNRQVLSNENNLGHAKSVEARLQMKQINSEIRVNSIQGEFNEYNGRDLIYGHDVVVDALDNVEARLALENACEAEGIPLVHGAIGGWNGQVSVVMPGDRTLHTIYAEEASSIGDEAAEKPTNPFFTPALVSAIEVAEAIKLLLDRKETLQGKILSIDLLEHEYDVIEL